MNAPRENGDRLLFRVMGIQRTAQGGKVACPHFRILAALAVAVGLTCFVLGLALGHRGPVLAGLGAAWLWAAGIAAGSVALSAAVQLSDGSWAEPVRGPAERSWGFLLPGALLLILMVLTSRLWMSNPEALGGFFIAREIIVTLALLVAARVYLQRRAGGRPAGVAAVVYCLVYVIALSNWAVDFTSGTRHWAPTTVLPPFYFMSALMGGLAWSAAVALLRDRDLSPDGRHDTGKLLFGLAVFWTYLGFAAYLPVWYENMPDETGMLLDRVEGGFKPVAYGMIALVSVLPFLILLTEWAKRRVALITTACLAVLVGLGLECFLLVFPALPYRTDGLAAVFTAGSMLGVVGLFFLSARPRARETAPA